MCKFVAFVLTFLLVPLTFLSACGTQLPVGNQNDVSGQGQQSSSNEGGQYDDLLPDTEEGKQNSPDSENEQDDEVQQSAPSSGEEQPPSQTGGQQDEEQSPSADSTQDEEQKPSSDQPEGNNSHALLLEYGFKDCSAQVVEGGYIFAQSSQASICASNGASAFIKDYRNDSFPRYVLLDGASGIQVSSESDFILTIYAVNLDSLSDNRLSVQGAQTDIVFNLVNLPNSQAVRNDYSSFTCTLEAGTYSITAPDGNAGILYIAMNSKLH